MDRKDRIEVTGQGLILRPIKWWLKFIDDIAFEISSFKRVDICLDVQVETDYLVRHIFLPVVLKKTHKPYCVKGTYTGLDIGEKSAKNTWKFIRVYNKRLDTIQKGKEWLYDMDAMGMDYSRVEIELRRDKCKDLDASFLLSPEAQFDIFAHEVFWTHRQFWKHVHSEDAMKCVQSHLIDVFRDEKGMFRRFNVTNGETRKLLEERQERKLKYGSSFKSDADKRRAISTMRTIYARLRSENVLSYEETRDIFELIEQDLATNYETENSIT